MTGKKATLFYHNWLPTFRKLTLKQVGELAIALLEYDAEGKNPEFSDPLTDLAFTNFAEVVRMDREKYEQRVEANRLNGKKGGAPIGNRNALKQPKTTENNPKQPKQADIDIDIGIDIDTDMEMEKDIDNKIRTIIREWNFRKLKKAAITGIPFGQKRYNDTFTCIAQHGYGRFMDEIRQLDQNAFFEDWHPSYDWFCNPNNFLKVMEGNYRDKKKDPNEIDWEAL